MSGATANRHVACLRAMFNRAIRQGFLAGPNPIASPAMERESPREVYLTVEQERRVIEA